MRVNNFSIGERVRARTARFVPEGTIGIIQHAYRSADDLYEVWFDGDSHGRVMHARDLERVARVPETNRQDAAVG